MRCNESPHTIMALLAGVTVTVMAALPVGCRATQDDDTSSVLGGAVLDGFLPADLNDNHNNNHTTSSTAPGTFLHSVAIVLSGHQNR